MTRHAQVLVACSTLILLPAVAVAQSEQEPAPSVVPPADAPPPSEAPPPPSVQPPPPPSGVQVQASSAAGQWVYTEQYGWVWMPYADRYTYVPPNGYGVPYAYLYYPAYGWGWVEAPWIWGWGPWPYFGVGVVFNFGWYSSGYWRYPTHWHYAPGYVHPGFRSVPHHHHGAPAVRPAHPAPRMGGHPPPRGPVPGGGKGGWHAPSRGAPQVGHGSFAGGGRGGWTGAGRGGFTGGRGVGGGPRGGHVSARR